MKNCWVAVITHSFGTDATVCATQELAVNEVYQYVKEWWNQISDQPVIEDKWKAIEHYFDKTNGMESYDIIESPMIGFQP